MSKYVKNLITDHLRECFQGVGDALLVNVIGLDANANNRLRTELDSKDINLMVVKNSLAARATAGTPISAMFEGLTGTAAVCWGGTDIVALAKEITRLAKKKEYEAFEPRGGVMDGETLSLEQVAQVSTWASREEVLCRLVGQIIAPATGLAALLGGPGSLLASQVGKLAEEDQEEGEASAA